MTVSLWWQWRRDSCAPLDVSRSCQAPPRGSAASRASWHQSFAGAPQASPLWAALRPMPGAMVAAAAAAAVAAAAAAEVVAAAAAAAVAAATPRKSAAAASACLTEPPLQLQPWPQQWPRALLRSACAWAWASGELPSSHHRRAIPSCDGQEQDASPCRQSSEARVRQQHSGREPRRSPVEGPRTRAHPLQIPLVDASRSPGSALPTRSFWASWRRAEAVAALTIAERLGLRPRQRPEEAMHLHPLRCRVVAVPSRALVRRRCHHCGPNHPLARGCSWAERRPQHLPAPAPAV